MKGGDDRMAQRTVAICNGKYIGIETIYEVEILQRKIFQDCISMTGMFHLDLILMGN